MTRYFGTDGIRATINTGAMTAENIVRLALAVGYYFSRHNVDGKPPSKRRPLVIIGKDTRLSGYMVEAALHAGFASIGMDTRLLGPVPTPAVAYLTRTLRAEVGVMISASHNPHYDNGIKLFGPDGHKLPDAVEDEIAKIMTDHIALAEPENLGRARRLTDGLGRYMESIKVAIPRNMRLTGLKVVVDCANGAAYRAAPEILYELGAEVIPLAVSPDGLNINRDCGAVHPEAMAAGVVSYGADIGIALDGDADRLIMADEKGVLINGDQCLAVIADSMIEEGRLRGDKVVGTLMTNHGLERYFADKSIGLMRTQVGDRYILDAMRQNDLNLGGEPSGHILMTDYATSGDGLMSALVMLSSLLRAEKPASEALFRFDPTPQTIINVVSDSHEAMTQALDSDQVVAAISDAKASLGETGRIIIRPSGTESVLRIMVETSDAKLMNQVSGTLSGLIRTVMTDAA